MDWIIRWMMDSAELFSIYFLMRTQSTGIVIASCTILGFIESKTFLAELNRITEAYDVQQQARRYTSTNRNFNREV